MNILATGSILVLLLWGVGTILVARRLHHAGLGWGHAYLLSLLWPMLVGRFLD